MPAGRGDGDGLGESGTGDVGQVPGGLPGLSSGGQRSVREAPELIDRTTTTTRRDDDNGVECVAARPASRRGDARWLAVLMSVAILCVRACVCVCVRSQRNTAALRLSSLIKTSHVVKPLRQLSRSPHIKDLITRAARLFILCGIVSRERGKFNFGEVFLTRREWRCNFYIKTQRQGQNAL